MARSIPTRVVLILLTVALVATPGFSADPPTKTTLAWIRCEDASQAYTDVPYLWLGDIDLELEIAVRPSADHVLELYWGKKRDRRDAMVTINGQSIPIAGGPNYDGFRWMEVPVPANISGSKYTISLRQGHVKPAFIGAVRLTTSGDAGTASLDPLDPAVAVSQKIRVISATPASTDAFPRMQVIWDRRPEPSKTPLADAQVEASFVQAERNSRRNAEMYYRCRRFVDGWLAQSDPTTGLIPRNLKVSRTFWNAKDSAADNYPFMVLTSALTDRALFDGRMLDMLNTEIRVTSRVDRLPDTFSFTTQAFESEEVDLDSILFGGSEYVKDGLLPLTEWLGASPWRDRMLGIVDDIWKHANVETPHGLVPTSNIEVHGEMLQVLARVYWMTGDEKYLDWAVRLGDYYLLGDQHPTKNLESLRLRDHGCEVVSGLAELYVAVNFARPEKKAEYEEPIHTLFDRVLEIARDDRGMLYNTVNPITGEHDAGICDTWGYNYNGIYAVYMVDGTKAYRKAVRHVLSQLTEHLTDYHWGSADEYADSIEGAINLYNREPVQSAVTWIDSEIDDMWSGQQPSGVIEGWHGDGNIARTAIMYALWKSQGLTIRPWREDVRLGAVEQEGSILVSLTADKPWSGQLVCDKPRHKVQMGLRIDYPRINQFPEWFTTESETQYVVRDLTTETKTVFSGSQLQEGIPFALAGGERRRLILSVQPAANKQ